MLSVLLFSLISDRNRKQGREKIQLGIGQLGVPGIIFKLNGRLPESEDGSSLGEFRFYGRQGIVCQQIFYISTHRIESPW